MLRPSTKTKPGAKALKRVAKNPGLMRLAPPVAGVSWKFAQPLAAGLGWKFAPPLTKRRARKRAERVGEAARGIAATTTTYAPYVIRAIDALAPPQRKRLTPRIGAGAVLSTGAALGALAVYLLAPGGGREHRRQLRSLVK